MWDRFLWTGLALQAGAFVIAWACGRLLYAISWLGVLVFAVPTFLAGVGFVLVSGAWWPVRVVLGFWPLAWPLYYIGVYVLERRQLRHEMFLVPAGYTGPVKVEFDAADGSEPEMEGGVRVYRVSLDGTLRTRAESRLFSSTSLNQDRSDGRRVFTVDEAGARAAVADPTPFDLNGLDDGLLIVTPIVEYYNDRRVIRLAFEVGTVAQVRQWLRGPG